MSMPISGNPFQNVLNAGQNFLNAGLNQTDAIKDTSALLTEARDSVAKVEKYMIIGAIALAALGVVLACAIGACAVIPFVMSAALVYGIYNLECVKTNIDDIIADPSQCAKIDLATLSTSVDSDKIKAKLLEKTFCFEWAIDLAISNSPLAATKP